VLLLNGKLIHLVLYFKTCSFLEQVFLYFSVCFFVISPQVEITKPDEYIFMKMIVLAPIEVEILLCPPRRTQKIVTDSGISS